MRRHLAAGAIAVAAALLLAACGEGEEEEGPTMLPGSDCLASGCHASGEHRLTAAGTVFAGGDSTAGVAGAVVTLAQTGGPTLTLTTNSVGNFYTRASLGLPLTVSVSHGGFSSVMAGGAPSGACGSCHAPAGSLAARVHVGRCTDCH